ncbi:MAG: dTDP-4-dehydrorhamnose reductase [Candidatus Bathyarchaeia archaeon]
MKLLITGASGLLGTKLCQTALRKNYEVYAAYSQHKPRCGTPVELNILDPKAEQQALDKVKPEAVVHAAALTDVDKCELEKELAWTTNVEATTNLARLCKKRGAFLVYVSTDYVFNGEKGMYKETDKPAPINYYGLTKLKGEEAVQTLDNYCIARGSVIYGSTPATGKANFASWLLDKLRKKEEVKIITDQWNSPTLNISMAEMIIETIEKRKTGTFHLAGATRLSRYEFAQHLAKTFDLDPKYITPAQSKHIKWVARRPKDSSLNVKKAEQTLTNKPLGIDEALEIMKIETA